MKRMGKSIFRGRWLFKGHCIEMLNIVKRSHSSQRGPAAALARSSSKIRVAFSSETLQACKPRGSWSRCVSRLFNDSRSWRLIAFEISTGCPRRSTLPTATMRGALLRHSYHAPFQEFETTGPPFAANWQLVMSIEEPTSSFKTQLSLLGSGSRFTLGVSPVISLTSWGSTNSRIWICAWIALESSTRPRRMQKVRCKVSMYPCKLPHPFRRKTHRSALILVSRDMWMPLHVPCFTTQPWRITCDSEVDVSCCKPEKLMGYTVITLWLPINSHLTNVAMPPRTVHASHVGARGARILQSVKFQLPATISTAQR